MALPGTPSHAPVFDVIAVNCPGHDALARKRMRKADAKSPGRRYKFKSVAFVVKTDETDRVLLSHQHPGAIRIGARHLRGVCHSLPCGRRTVVDTGRAYEPASIARERRKLISKIRLTLH